MSTCIGLVGTGFSEREAEQELQKLYPNAVDIEIKILVDRNPKFSGLTGRKVFCKVDTLEATINLH